MGMTKNTCIIRREIQAPEVDEYDEVKTTAIRGNKKDFDIGVFVEYTL
ncbi:hypothetical protein K2Q02_00385 [Patescibacteria group bacterium]|nr:hypothetical protein [Patescibacteria group bacterium]